jgi:hypothetical protein
MTTIAASCRDCGTTVNLIAHGKAWRCADFADCKRHQREHGPATCADCGRFRGPGAWQRVRVGRHSRTICADTADCLTARDDAAARGLSVAPSAEYAARPRPALPVDASDLYN